MPLRVQESTKTGYRRLRHKDYAGYVEQEQHHHEACGKNRGGTRKDRPRRFGIADAYPETRRGEESRRQYRESNRERHHHRFYQRQARGVAGGGQ